MYVKILLFFSENNRHKVYKFINLDEAKVVDILLQLEIDFEKKILHGAVTLTVERKLESATHLVSKFLLNDCTFTISGK